jgi:hypothetical protein
MNPHSMPDSPASLCGRNTVRKGHIGGKVTLGGLERWFSPRGQDLAFLLSCIGLVRPSSSADLKQNKTKQNTVHTLCLITNWLKQHDREMGGKTT